jgi:hypothetical protein
MVSEPPQKLKSQPCPTRCEPGVGCGIPLGNETGGRLRSVVLLGGGWPAARRRSGSIIERMLIGMNEAQVPTLGQVRQVLAGTQAMEFQEADDAGRCAWIDSVLRRLEHRRLPRGDRGPVPACLQRLGGCSRARAMRRVARWIGGTPLVKNHSAPKHAHWSTLVLRTPVRAHSGAERPWMWRCWPRWIAPSERCRARPRHALRTAGATSSAMSVPMARLDKPCSLSSAARFLRPGVTLTETRPDRLASRLRTQGAQAHARSGKACLCQEWGRTSGPIRRIAWPGSARVWLDGGTPRGAKGSAVPGLRLGSRRDSARRG